MLPERSCRFLSHSKPEILLKDHLKDVGELCYEYVRKCANDKKMWKTGRLIGLSHDLGKYTVFFQHHLQGEKVRGDLYKHSRLSAVLAVWLVKRRFSDPFLALTAFNCVLSHHGGLKNFSELGEKLKSLPDSVLIEQINSINKNLNVIRDELGELGLEDLVEFFEDPNSGIEEVKNIWYEVRRPNDIKLYLKTLLLYSSLIDADRKDAGRVLERFKEKEVEIPSEVLLSYKDKLKSKKPINKIRDELFSAFKENIDKIDDIPAIATITAPTGLGKTILSLYAALKIQEKERNPRIIYSLPFINIIEQTHSTIKGILSQRFEVSVDLLLKHHHLAIAENQEELFSLLADSWDSKIIVTTFEQLLRSIIGSRASLLRKFHNIANSIIILDEVQAIPVEYWKDVQETLRALTEIFNVKIIMITATRPAIFQGKELVPNPGAFFRKLNRTTIEPVLEEQKPDELANLFLSKWQGESTLIVLNTIKASKVVYRRISKELGDKAVRLGLEDPERDSKIVLAYLSTSLVPKDRKKRVETIINLLKKGRKVILVSTQAVEAGVDLDFELTFRDVGPLDSIIQISGRCNRNWERGKSKVYIVRMKDEKERYEAEKIYGKVSPKISLKLLKTVKSVEEKDYLGLITKYYSEVLRKCNASLFLDYIRKLNYGELSNFTLIEDKPKVPVLIELSDEVTIVLDKLKEALRNLKAEEERDKIFEKRAEIRRLRAELENYITEVWPDSARGLKKMEELGILFVPRNEVEAYYDPETGFKEREYEYIW